MISSMPLAAILLQQLTSRARTTIRRVITGSMSIAAGLR